MSIATIETQPRVENVEVIGDMLSIRLIDGRVLSVPLAWYPRLKHATDVEREEWRVFEDSDERDIIFWEVLDELIPVVALLAGVPSRESSHSLENWLAERTSDGTSSKQNDAAG
jgi:hypothetical protein